MMKAPLRPGTRPVDAAQFAVEDTSTTRVVVDIYRVYQVLTILLTSLTVNRVGSAAAARSEGVVGCHNAEAPPRRVQSAG